MFALGIKGFASRQSCKFYRRKIIIIFHIFPRAQIPAEGICLQFVHLLHARHFETCQAYSHFIHCVFIFLYRTLQLSAFYNLNHSTNETIISVYLILMLGTFRRFFKRLPQAHSF